MSESASIQHPNGLTPGDFTEADEPMRLFASWFAEAKRAESDANAMTLATVDDEGMPNARMVLLKGFDEGGFVFYTNVDSPKGRELSAAGKAALVFHWNGRAGCGGGGRYLFRHPPALGADRGLGQQAVGAAGESDGA